MDNLQCYEILGLNVDASPSEIKQAYRDLVEVWHPDRFSHNPRLRDQAEEKTKQINAAYTQVKLFAAEQQTREYQKDSSVPKDPTYQHQSPSQEERFSQAESWEDVFDNISSIKWANKALADVSLELTLPEALLCAHLKEEGGCARIQRRYSFKGFGYEQTYRVAQIPQINTSRPCDRSPEHIEKFSSIFWTLKRVPKVPPKQLILHVKKVYRYKVFWNDEEFSYWFGMKTN